MNRAVSPSTPAIEFRNVSCRFISPEGKATVALRDFSMSVARGEFIAIVGPTGCGKSTTLNLITGLLKPATGEVRVMGRPVDGIDPRIGFVFQADAVFPWRNVIDNVAAGHAVSRPLEGRRVHAGRMDPQGRPRQVHEALPAPAVRRDEEARRARADLHQPAGNPADGRAVLRARHADAHADAGRAAAALVGEQKPVVFVTHDLEEAIALADRVFVLTARPATLARVRDRPAAPARHVGDPLRHALHRNFKDIWHDLREEVQIG